MDVQRFGRTALLVELGSPEAARAFAAAVRRSPAPGQVDAAAAETSVLVVFDAPGRLDAARRHLIGIGMEPGSGLTGRVVEVPTRYDGEDLATVAEAVGVTVREVVDAHAGQTWTAAFNGFAPGFSYLTGETDALVLPRRATPRTAVPAGSVAIADRYSAVYPRISPGGWHLIGRTDAVLWDSGRTPPALIAPGDAVRFVPVRSLTGAKAEPGNRSRTRVSAPRPAGVMTVLSPGLQSLVEDGGRPGHFADAAPRSGAADRASWLAANQLVGNRFGAAAIETLFGGLRVRCDRPTVLALTGASPGAWITGPDDEREVPAWSAFALRPGEELEVDAPTEGVRSYLAVRGGLDVPAELGSRATDLLTGLGPAPLVAGAELPIGDAADDSVDPRVTPRSMPGDLLEVVVDLTERAALFTDEALDRLTRVVWTVTADSNRVGLRLNGEPLTLRAPVSLPSAGIVPGAVQVPPSGQPVVFLRDHPTTGGYPVVAVAAELDDLAQLPPAARLRFALRSP